MSNIENMVNRFLAWRLPADFSPDGGISFKRESDYEHPQFGRTKFDPTGTNLLTAEQAKAMFEYVLEGAQQPQAEAVPVVDRVYEAAKRLVDHADFQLGGVLSAKSKTRDIPSNAASKVKARHLASLRDALAKTPHQAEAVPSDVVRDASPVYVALKIEGPRFKCARVYGRIYEVLAVGCDKKALTAVAKTAEAAYYDLYYGERKVPKAAFEWVVEQVPTVETAIAAQGEKP